MRSRRRSGHERENDGYRPPPHRYIPPDRAAYDSRAGAPPVGRRDERQLLGSPHYGGLVESLVCMECCKHAAWAEEEVGPWRFRDHRKREADIVLERGDSRIIGVEVKASASVRPEDFKGLAAPAELAGGAFERGVLFYGGREALPFRFGERRFHALPLGMLPASGRARVAPLATAGLRLSPGPVRVSRTGAVRQRSGRTGQAPSNRRISGARMR